MNSFLLLAELPKNNLLFIAMWIGACLTSFGRVAVYRLPHQLGWRDNPEPNLTLFQPHSRCESCNTRISVFFLLPILGWFFAKGQCPSCKTRISALHPIIEIIGGIGWVSALLYFGFTPEGFWACFLWQILLFLAEIDWREHWLPAVVTFPLFWIGLLFSPFTESVEERVLGSFIGFTAMWLSMVVVTYFKKIDVFAGGDIALACSAGAWIGIDKIPLFLFITAVTFILIALPARMKGKMMVPMGPALAIGFLTCIALCK
ncbi:TPA: A24 family peptidase [Enterobacter asburiae]